jgi:ADP-ribose pyrophosphatase
MERKRGSWTIKETTSPYKDNFIEVFVDQVIKPDGKPGTYATVRMKKGVAVLPVTKDGKVYLTSQFRYAIGRDSIEVVSGGMDGEEPPIEAAKREAKEELGIEAEDWIDMGFFAIETSIVQAPVYLFMVKGLEFSETDPDNTEDIKRMKITLDEALQMVMNNEIIHGPSCVLILKAHKYLHENV